MKRNKFEKMPTHTQILCVAWAVVSVGIFACGADGIMNGNFFMGVMLCIAYGFAAGAIASISYIVAEAIAPQKTKKIIEKFFTPSEE